MQLVRLISHVSIIATLAACATPMNAPTPMDPSYAGPAKTTAARTNPPEGVPLAPPPVAVAATQMTPVPSSTAKATDGALPTSQSVRFVPSEEGKGLVGTPQPTSRERAMANMLMATAGIGTLVMMGIPFGALLGTRHFEATIPGSFRRPE